LICPQIHPDYVRSATLGREITELCAYAATYKLLVMIREFDPVSKWEGEKIDWPLAVGHLYQ
jgi:hypothetical protein